MGIQDVLLTLGITPKYKGFHLLSFAVGLVMEDSTRLSSVAKLVFTPTAEHFGCPLQCVERDIRTVVARAWATNPEFLRKIARYPLHKAPSNTDFIAIVSAYLNLED